MSNPFTQHPHEANETYCQHLLFAGWSGIKLILGGLSLLIHAIFPFLFTYTASNLVKNMYQTIMQRCQECITKNQDTQQ